HWEERREILRPDWLPGAWMQHRLRRRGHVRADVVPAPRKLRLIENELRLALSASVRLLHAPRIERRPRRCRRRPVKGEVVALLAHAPALTESSAPEVSSFHAARGAGGGKRVAKRGAETGHRRHGRNRPLSSEQSLNPSALLGAGGTS